MGDFAMPSLGADMESGTVVKWLVGPGDAVHRGDVVAEVETDKSTIEVEIFQDGVIGTLLVPEGRRVPVGTPLARVEDVAGARAPRRAKRPPTPPRAPAAAPPAAVAPAAVAPPTPQGGQVTLSPVVRRLAAAHGIDVAALHGSGPAGTVTRADVEAALGAAVPRTAGRTRSSPIARRRAAELGVDLGAVEGTGPGGSVVLDDVLRAVGAPPVAWGVTAAEAVAPEEVVEEAEVPAEERSRRQAAALRRSIGELMARSKREVPHYYLSTTIDAEAAMCWLEAVNLGRPVADRLVAAALLLKATALAVHRVPEMNGHYVDGEFTPSPSVHVGVAVSLRGGGVLAPAIHHTDELSLDELMRQLGDLVARTRSGKLRSSEMSDPTITVSNLGDLGVDEVFGIIYPPQVALVGFGRVAYRPQAKDGMLGVRRCVTASLSADHRVSDGHRGGRFLAEIDRLIQEPEKL